MAIPPLPQLNTTVIGVLPDPIVSMLQRTMAGVYALMGGVIGFFILSFFIRWRETRRLKKRLARVERMLVHIDGKLKGRRFKDKKVKRFKSLRRKVKKLKRKKVRK